MNKSTTMKKVIKNILNVTPSKSTNVDERWSLLNTNVIPESDDERSNESGIYIFLQQFSILGSFFAKLELTSRFKWFVTSSIRNKVENVSRSEQTRSRLMSFLRSIKKAIEKSLFEPKIDSSSVFVPQTSVGRTNGKNAILIIINFSLLILLGHSQAIGQAVSINPTGANPHSSAMLDVTSTDKGILIPRVTKTQRNAITSPATGLMVFMTTDTVGFFFYNGAKWETIISGNLEIPNKIIDADGNTQIQVEESANEDKIRIDLGGTEYIRFEPKGLINLTNSNSGAYLGGSAGSSISSGTQNTFIGHEAGANTATSHDNTFIGYRAGYVNGIGGKNTFVGSMAGDANTSGDNNTSIGYSSGSAINTGDDNTFVGYNAGRLTESGLRNTFIGTGAGDNNTTGNDNISIGYNSGYATGTASNNVNIGNNILGTSSSTNGSVLIGHNVANKLTGGNFNTVIGVDAVSNLFSGHSNTILGQNVASNIAGAANSNVLIGRDVLSNAGAADNNVVLGYGAGLNTTSLTSSVLIGYTAGSNANGTGQLYIDNSDTTKPLVYGNFESDSLVINGKLITTGQVGIGNTTPGVYPWWGNDLVVGHGSGSGGGITLASSSTGKNHILFSDITSNNVGRISYAHQTDVMDFYTAGSERMRLDNSGNLGIGTTSPDTKLHVAGSIKIVDGNQANGKILTSDANGVASWATPTLSTPTLIEDADQDTKIQVEEGADDDIIRFDMGGTEYFRMDSGRFEVYNTGRSMFFGRDAGLNDDRTFNRGVFIGDSAGVANSTGTNNVFVGYLAGVKNTTGAFNTFVGTASGEQNVGTRNTLLGNGAGRFNTSGSQNVMLGMGAGTNNASGNFNTLIGYKANNSGQDGDRNVLIGYEAGATDSTHSKTGAVYIGYQAGFSDTSSNKLYIENSNSTTPLIWGDFANDSLKINGHLSSTNGLIVSSGNVGIGTTTPSDLLHLKGTTADDADYQMILESTINGSGAGISFQSNDGTNLKEMAKINSYATNAWNTSVLTQSADLRFFTTVLGTATEKMRINASGAVGIGTDPSAKFHLHDAAGLEMRISTNNAASPIKFKMDAPNSDFEMWYSNRSANNSFEMINDGDTIFRHYGSDGHFEFNKGNVGIGTNSPSGKLSLLTSETSQPLILTAYAPNLAANADIYIKMGQSSSSGNEADIGFKYVGNNSAANRLHFGFNSTGELLSILNSGNVGIGTTAPTHLLDVNGTGRFTSNLDVEQEFGVRTPSGGNYLIFKGTNNTAWQVTTAGTSSPVTLTFDAIGTFTTYFDGNVFVNGSTPVTSDSSFKTEITPLTNVLQKLELIEGVSYFWDTLNFKDRNFSNAQDIGLIAQKLQRIYPQLVLQREDGYLAVDYSKFTAVLLQAIKEQQAIINQQNVRLTEVEASNTSILKRLETIENLIPVEKAEK